MIPKVLSIAGSDPSGGAGIQADLKTFGALGCYGMAVITALTAQNTREVSAVEVMSAEFVRQQLIAIFDDVAVHGVKIGMIADAQIAEVVADILEEFKPPNIVLDPVMVATSGDSLIDKDAMGVLKARLIPLADVITPNIPEAEKLLRKAVLDIEDGARDLLLLGADAALLKGGHLSRDVMSNDVLAFDKGIEVFKAKRILTSNTHGTGCTLSSAIVAHLAKEMDLKDAVQASKEYLTGAIQNADALGVGHGHGPVNHFWNVRKGC
ncbi:MAG: bifunctional hydroxymethylpyrimidine kinase/phosphomethylpyrimidine kinase [Bdellovibrionales bacterium]